MNTTLPDPDGDLLVPGEPPQPDATFDEPAARGSTWAEFKTWFQRPDDGIVGGVAADLARRLGLDVLWVRLAFVVLLLIGGLGAVAYAGLWLTLVVGADRGWARVAGGAVLLVLVPLLIANADLGLATGTGAVVILLIGLTLALWNRGVAVPADSQPAASVVRADTAAGPHQPSDVEITPRDATRSFRRTRTPRPPSILGRLVFGAAVIVAASGALIDELNGGRLHPEQWLGAAAVVCGLGLLVGALRGHARWLIVPAAAFAVVGFLAGESAGLGLTLGDVGGGDRYRFVSQDDGGPVDATLHSVFGATSIDVQSAPRQTARIEARTAFGDVNISSSSDVTIQLIGRADGGGIGINGRSVGNGTHLIGPDGAADVVIDARTLHGEIMVYVYDREQFVEELDPTAVTVDSSSGDQIIGEGVQMLPDGTVVLLNGQGVIGPDNQPVIGDWYTEDESRVEWSTEMGTWQLVGSVLVTPFGQVLDLDALRTGPGSQPLETVPDGSSVPVTTAEPVPTTTAVPATTIAPQEG